MSFFHVKVVASPGTVSLEKTKRRYHGKTAEHYEAVRGPQERFRVESAVVESWLVGARGKRLLDVPVGTGRLLPVYDKLGLGPVLGVDTSEDMLALARKKRSNAILKIGDATSLFLRSKSVDVTVCVRFLNLIPEDAAFTVLQQLCRVTREQIILTIRLGELYEPKNTCATHDKKKWLKLITKLGWCVADTKLVFRAGWTIQRLVPIVQSRQVAK